MNCIYMYTNKTREKEGLFPNKYIGSKAECGVFKVDGSDTLFSYRGDKVYYGSSSNQLYWDHHSAGDVFEVSILEEVPERAKLREIEYSHLEAVDAASSAEYYNLTNVTIKPSPSKAPHMVINKFGETFAEYAQRCSNLSKRDGSAKLFGFSNFGYMAEDILIKYRELGVWAQVAKLYGKHKGYARVFMQNWDLDKFEQELTTDVEAYRPDIRKMVALGASVQKSADILGIEFPTARIACGDYHFGDSREYLTAYNLGMTNAEVQEHLMTEVLSGISISQASTAIGMNPTTGKRYFYACLRASLDPSEIRIGERVSLNSTH